MNLYAYCGNNPINWIDPWGLSEEWPWFNGFWGTVCDLSIVGTVAHAAYDFGVGIRKTGELIIGSMRSAYDLGQQRRNGQEEVGEGRQFIPNDRDHIGNGQFQDWAKDTEDKATSVPGTSATGPIASPASPAEFGTEVVKGAIGGSCEQKQGE